MLDGLRSTLVLLTLALVVGAPQKYRVEANGQLAVSNLLSQESHDPDDGDHIGDRGGATMIRSEKGGDGSLDSRGSTDKVIRGGYSLQETNSSASGALSTTSHPKGGDLKCGWTAFAPDDPCPSDCPLLAEETWNPCHFQCVKEEECGTLDPKATIADYGQSRCRRCVVAGCETCSSGGKDKCHKCSVGYFLDDHGHCYSGGWYIWEVIRTLVVVLALVLLLWTIELICRRPSNLKGLDHGRKFRKRTRCHMPHDTPPHLGVVDPEDSEGLLYPLSTNLMVTPCGGAGTTLHFSFQVYAIVWAFLLAGLWGGYAGKCGYDLLRLGTLPAVTPQQLCSVVRWGAVTQEKFMNDTFSFCVLAWLFQFVGSLVFAIYQQKRFALLDDNTTMKDFACYVRGLPKLKGEEDVEGLFKDFLEKETGQKLVGVSVAWDISTKAFDEVNEALELENIANEKAHTLLKNGGKAPEEDEEDTPLPPGALTKVFGNLDKAFGFGLQGTMEPPGEVDVDRVRELLESLTTSDVAFAVFETEVGRDVAVEMAKAKRGFVYEEKHTVRLETKAVEPGTVRWDGISYGSRTRVRNTKMVCGALFVLLSLATWGVVFYMPYAYYVTAFTYANGEEPSWFQNMTFTMLVVAGNQIMYLVCDLVTQWADFAFEDEREFWYNVYYLTANVLNVTMDLIITGVLSYKEMVGMGVHTADGKLLESQTDVQDIIESYPMQKTMGNMLFAYSFPGTFLTPFLLEPFVTVFVPFWFGCWLVRSHPEAKGRQAELSLVFFTPMNLGRYSDLLLNMNLAAMALFLPAGYFLPTFLSMGLSHIFVYLFDHWKVLRGCPDYCFSRNTVDTFGSGWMALPTALTAACCVFRGYHQYWPELHDARLFCVMLWAFAASLGFHIWCLKKIYKIKMPHENTENTYADCAQWEPKTWFSMNPVHCLRSKYIWGHEPSQVFYMHGKQHLQRKNEEIGAYYENKKAQEPDPPKKDRKSLKEAQAEPTAKAKAKAKA